MPKKFNIAEAKRELVEARRNRNFQAALAGIVYRHRKELNDWSAVNICTTLGISTNCKMYVQTIQSMSRYEGLV